MNRNELALKLVKRWVKKISKKEAIRRLADRRLSPITAEKICGGRYPSVPRDLLATVLLEEMAKDGIYLEDKAS